MTDKLEDLRETVDEIDQSLVEKLDRRAEVVQEIGALKHERDMDLYVPGREREILDRLEKLGTGTFPPSSLRIVFREIIATCLNLEKPVTVGYLGPEATFTHSAALKRFGNSTELKGLESIDEIFNEVERNEVDYGIVPVENSSEGAVRHTLDRFLSSNLRICSECYLQVQLHLMSSEEDLRNIERVYSHGQALSQARQWLDSNLPNVPVEEAPSTAKAARIAHQEAGTAAVASEVAADIYGLNLLVRNIEQPTDNYTRFLVIGRHSSEPTGDDKTTIAFSVQDRTGALQEMIAPFGNYDINMTKIESRPSREKTWDYIFFVDFQGHQEDESVKALIEDLRTTSSMFKVLGSYPRENPFNT